MTEYGEMLGGSNAVYNVKANEGDKVRVFIPGLYPIETTIILSPYGSLNVEILGKRYFLADRSNGQSGDTDHSWTFQLEEKEPTALEQFQALPVGTEFHIVEKGGYVDTFVRRLKVSETHYFDLNLSLFEAEGCGSSLTSGYVQGVREIGKE